GVFNGKAIIKFAYQKTDLCKNYLTSVTSLPRVSSSLPDTVSLWRLPGRSPSHHNTGSGKPAFFVAKIKAQMFHRLTNSARGAGGRGPMLDAANIFVGQFAVY
ncbi:hypothetical protein FRB91_002873, partial [Serendipita sp. 411]